MIISVLTIFLLIYVSNLFKLCSNLGLLKTLMRVLFFILNRIIMIPTLCLLFTYTKNSLISNPYFLFRQKSLYSSQLQFGGSFYLFSWVILITFFLEITVFILFDIDLTLSKRKAENRLSSEVLVKENTCYFMMFLFYLFIEFYPVQGLIVTVLGGYITLTYIFYTPFFSYAENILQIARSLILFLFGISYIIAVLIDSSAILLYCFFFLYPLVLYLSYKWMKRSIKTSN